VSADVEPAFAESDDASDETGTERDDSALSRYQWVAVGLGALLATVGIVAAVLGVSVASLSFLLLVALTALLVAMWRGYTHLAAGVSVRTPPRVGRRAGVRRTGSDLESTLRDADGGSDRERGPARVGTRRRLEPLAKRLLARRTGTTEQEALDALRGGSWTDDPTAARLFEQGGDDGSLAALLRRTPSMRAQVHALVADLGAKLLGGTPAGALGPREDDGPVGTATWEAEARATGHWRGVSAAGLATLSLAVLLRTPGLLLVAGMLLGVAGYARLGTAPDPALAVERTVSAANPRPGDHVTVTVTVENDGAVLLPDLRVVDDVPADLRVVSGSPGHATALRPGESATFEYDILAVYGDHTFESLYTVTYDASGHHERTGRATDGGYTLTCEPTPVQESVPLHPQTSGVVGRVPTNVGGSGHEFHSAREYRRGDPLRRVDWNRVARTGDLATLQFREEHAATVVILVDTRAAAFQAPTRDALSAVDRSLAGTAQVFESLLADGDRVGVANIGLDWSWVAPSAGSDHRERVRTTLQSDPNFGGTRHDIRFAVDRYVERLRRRLPSDAQLILFSPLLDEKSAETARRLHAHGHSVTAFSPNPTGTDTIGASVARIERLLALETLRESGIPVVDWGHDEPLPVAVERAAQGWGR
jgi:uncharacterized repeat protein (TIGR01451 family)